MFFVLTHAEPEPCDSCRRWAAFKTQKLSNWIQDKICKLRSVPHTQDTPIYTQNLRHVKQKMQIPAKKIHHRPPYSKRRAKFFKISYNYPNKFTRHNQQNKKTPPPKKKNKKVLDNYAKPLYNKPVPTREQTQQQSTTNHNHTTMTTQYLICVTTKFYGPTQSREYVNVLTDNEGYNTYDTTTRDLATRLTRAEAKAIIDTLNDTPQHLPHNAYAVTFTMVKA